MIEKARRKHFSPIAIEDIVQDTFQHILNQINQGNLDDMSNEPNVARKMKASIFKYSFNDAISRNGKYEFERKPELSGEDDFIRSSQVHEMIDRELYKMIKRETHIKLRRVIERLLPAEKKLIHMHYFNGLKIKKIAHKLHESEDVIKMRLFRIRRKMAPEMLSDD